MMKTRKICLLLALSCSTFLFAQSTDKVGMNTSVEVSKKVLPGLELSLEEEFRFRDNFSDFDRFSTTLGLSYKFNSYLKAGGAYNLINYNHPSLKKDWEIRHRYYFFAQGSYEYNRFTISLRERFQSTFRQGVYQTDTRANPKLYLRSRLELSYDIRKSNFEPYVSCEFYNSLNSKTGNGMDQISCIVGAKYKINKRNSLELYYKNLNFEEDDEDENRHIIGLGYSHKF